MVSHVHGISGSISAPVEIPETFFSPQGTLCTPLRHTSHTSGNTTSLPSSGLIRRCTTPSVSLRPASSITICSLWMGALPTTPSSGSSSTSVRTLKEPLPSTAKVRFLESSYFLWLRNQSIPFQSFFFFFFFPSWPRENRHSDWLLHDETLPPDCSRGHRLDTDLQTRVHHRAPAELCRRVGVAGLFSCKITKNCSTCLLQRCFLTPACVNVVNQKAERPVGRRRRFQGESAEGARERQDDQDLVWSG